MAIRRTAIMARRLVRPGKRPGGGEPWTPRGTVLVTGGTGAIAGHVTDWLARRGTPKAVLTSRSGPAATSAAGLAADLASKGTTVSLLAADTADRDATAAVLARIPAARPLTSVVHTAGPRS